MGVNVRRIIQFGAAFAALATLVLFVVTRTPSFGVVAADRVVVIVAAVSVMQLLIVFLYSLQWRTLLLAAGQRTRILEAFWARLAGSAVSYVTPALSVGGDVLRAGLLDRGRIGAAISGGVLGVDKLVELLTRSPAIVAGLAIFSTWAAAPPALANGARIVAVALSAAFVSVFLLFTVFARSARDGLPRPATFDDNGVKGSACAASGRRHRLFEQTRDAMRRFFHTMHELAGDTGAVARAAMFGVAANIVDVVHSFILLRVLFGLDLDAALALFALVVVQGVVAILPGNVGGMEATCMYAFNLIGAGTDGGLGYALFLRCAQLTWVAAGFGYLAVRWLRGASTRRNAVPPPEAIGSDAAGLHRDASRGAPAPSPEPARHGAPLPRANATRRPASISVAEAAGG